MSLLYQKKSFSFFSALLAFLLSKNVQHTHSSHRLLHTSSSLQLNTKQPVQLPVLHRPTKAKKVLLSNSTQLRAKKAIKQLTLNIAQNRRTVHCIFSLQSTIPSLPSFLTYSFLPLFSLLARLLAPTKARQQQPCIFW